MQASTGIDPWFLHRIQNIVRIDRLLGDHALERLPVELLREAKRAGFSDRAIARAVRPARTEEQVRAHRRSAGVVPVVKQIDTTAGEFPARTNYLYLTYHGDRHDLPAPAAERPGGRDQTVVVLGSGAYRIGSSVEFDWCCVNCIQSLRRLGYRTAIVNHNPETVSTDYDVADRLYFEELSVERLLDICELESPLGVVVSMGGQTPNNLALPLARAGLRILGTPPEAIDEAEDRHKFSALLDRLGVDQPRWREAASEEEAVAFAAEVGYPVLVRPSYVLSGAAMNAAYRDEDLRAFLARAARVSPEHPVVVSEFVSGAKEVEVDAVARDGQVLVFSLAEHVEFAGVHSGDSVIALPAQQVFVETVRRIKRIVRQIAASLRITGPFNVQFLARENRLRVIECNLRASRSFPFASKVFRTNFVDLATRPMMNEPTEDLSRSMFELDYVAVKAPQFSFARIAGADPVLGMEMASTGEVACFGDDLLEAFLKSLLSVGYTIPRKGVLLSTGTLEEKTKLLAAARRFAGLGLKLYATSGTATFLAANGIPTQAVHWPLDSAPSTALDLINSGAVDLVLNIPKSIEPEELTNDYLIRRQAVDRGVGLLVNAETAALFAQALERYKLEDLRVRAWDEYQ
ncbi:MAG: carbamoyl-phosphate synthase large subunit [Candidatus Wallbacteria bacterium]|nr:carbamoyl-phosphate synthase large subunit [Candidatus Wallbacteria bacterium]